MGRFRTNRLLALLLLVGFLFVSALPLPAAGAEIVSSPGEVAIKGDAPVLSWVNLLVERADGKKRAYIGQVFSGHDGSYQFEFCLPEGDYKAYVSGTDFSEVIDFKVEQDSPSNPGSGSEDGLEQKVFLSITGDSSMGRILAENVPLQEGGTVLEVLQRVAKLKGITIEVRGGYVAAINGLAEKKPGYPNSGWKYKVNGVYPRVSAADYILKNGDVVEWIYTLDYTKDADAADFKKPEEVELPAVEDKVFEKYLSHIQNIENEVLILNRDKRMNDKKAEELLKALGANMVNIKKETDEKGGIIGDGETAIRIPKKALNSPVEVSITELKPSAHPQKLGIKILSGVYEFEPSGLNFAASAVISIRLPIEKELDLNRITPAFYDEEKNKWQDLPGIIDAEEGLVLFKVEHFTKFAVIEKMPVKTFADVDETFSWAKDEIEVLAGMGIIKGTDEKSFEPGRNITRAEMVQLLSSIDADKSYGKPVAEFSDVKIGDWYYEAVQNAYWKGIVKGYPDNTFRPGQDITRLEAAVMLYNYLGLDEEQLAGSSAVWKDEMNIPLWGREKAKKVYQIGIIKGYEDETFRGDKPLTRAEAAVIVYRILESEL
ncbi:S-layer homology domain-containing protein [Thermosyntropha sp.]|uniref:S-layer homology domain-containing protein n=1 Tax=Thermosyntropha sp. TaxID=2740820 RepID=UPI0025DD8638|nr:S-layer homology domain-containing protein [Thermosyntropha sp.]MBO8159874.1 S-layer homology domain-containing protein [Thermosyntropha sp.]